MICATALNESIFEAKVAVCWQRIVHRHWKLGPRINSVISSEARNLTVAQTISDNREVPRRLRGAWG